MPTAPLWRTRARTRRARPTPLVAALAIGGLGACAAETPPEPPGTLTLAVRGDVTGFLPNPPTRTESFTYQVHRSVLDTLVGFDRTLALEPRLAERWENPDERTYVFELRRDARFSDGRPVTARDVAASLETAVREGWATRAYLEPIESVEALGDERLVVRTRSPDLTLLTRLPWGFVLPAEALDRRPAPTVGSGPYALEGWDPGREIRLVRNPHYWGRPPDWERVRFVVVPDGEERMAMVERGLAHVAEQVPPRMVERLQAREGLEVVSGPGHRVLFLAMNVREGPFADPRLREAVDLAVDRHALVERALSGAGSPANQLVPPAHFGHVPDLPPRPFDAGRARELVAASGYAGEPLRLDGPRNRYLNDVAVLEEVGRQLREVGLAVEVNALDKLELFERVAAHRSPLHLLGWASESGDAGYAFEFLFRSPRGSARAPWNTTGVADAELDRRIDASRSSLSVSERASHLRAAVLRLAELRPVVPLVVLREHVVHATAVDWQPGLNLALHPAEMRRASPAAGSAR